MVDIEVTFEDSARPFLRSLEPKIANRVFGPSLGKMAAVVRDRVKRTKNFGFRDGRGVRPADRAEGITRSVRLRSTIRVRRIRAYYGGQPYKRGKAAVYAGGKGARHAYLVHAGHGGPRPARPHPYLTEARDQTQAQQGAAFYAEASRRLPQAIASSSREARTRTRVSSISRTVSRRHRRR